MQLLSSLFPPARRRKFAWLCLPLLCLSLTARAQTYDDTFYNGGYLSNYTTPIDATNFINDFGATFSAPAVGGNNWLANLYDGWFHTINYTNNGEMDSISGFRFDIQNLGHKTAGTFYNAGNINCGINLFQITFFGVNGIFIGSPGIYVNATNIINSGTVNIGVDGLGRFSGNNIDLTRGTISMQTGVESDLLFGTALVSASGQTGRDTNSDWIPSIYLSPTTALSGIMKAPPFYLALTNSTPYFDIVGTGTTNVVVRAIFLQNVNTNAVPSVYFQNTGFGFATIQWAGEYIDPATGNPATNYLYLTDDYILGASTNVLNYAGGVPINYTFNETTSPLFLGPGATSNYPSLFGPNQPYPPGSVVTNNIYSYVDAQLIATSVSTNSVLNGALTNLPGRVEITASNELNLSLSVMNGMNYLLLKSTNQFDDDGQSQISVPFSDIYLGVTNGNASVTNLILPSIATWSGTVEAWNTRWFYTDTNSGVTYDFRVLIVNADVFPTTPTYEQDFTLNSSNNVILSDTLNVLRTLSINCTNLTITANGAGAGSTEGQVNIYSPNIAWTASFPRLRNLTNNGTITTVNLAKYGTPALPYFALVNSGVISNGNGSFVNALDFENTNGLFSSGNGTLSLQTLNTSITNSLLVAGGAFTNVARTSIISGSSLQVGGSLTIVATNLLTDLGNTNGSFWQLGGGNAGFGTASGLVLPIKPVTGDLLLTTIKSIAVTNTLVNELWAGNDRGATVAGFSNNAAVGQLFLDGLSTQPHTLFHFGGPGSSNSAIYVDNLVLMDSSTNFNGSGSLAELDISNNFVIYYAQAMLSGVSVAEKLNHANNNHLRWVPAYAGYYSSTNLVYPDGTTNTVNAALARSSGIDSDGDGTNNINDPTPFYVPSSMNFTLMVTNLPPLTALIKWQTLAGSTNYLYYQTNLTTANWRVLTNFVAPASGPVTVSDPVNLNMPRYYRLEVDPNSTLLYGP